MGITDNHEWHDIYVNHAPPPSLVISREIAWSTGLYELWTLHVSICDCMLRERCLSNCAILRRIRYCRCGTLSSSAKPNALLIVN